MTIITDCVQSCGTAASRGGLMPQLRTAQQVAIADTSCILYLQLPAGAGEMLGGDELTPLVSVVNL